jgi:vancomycin permeability regulator SanA
MKAFKKWCWWIIVPAALALCVLVFTLTVNLVVVCSVRGDIGEDFSESSEVYAIVLGAKVHEGGRLSDMLHDRMDAAIALYQEGKVQKLLLSGDGSGEWSEVKYMKLYAVKNGIPEEDILVDPEGYSTYATMKRAAEIYGLEHIIAVTQTYHLYRAMYIARDFGMEVKGASADLDIYSGQLYRDCREVVARIKDFGMCLFND